MVTKTNSKLQPRQTDKRHRDLGGIGTSSKVEQETQEIFDTLRDSYGPNPSPDDNEPPR
jgi:hypothetical protein